MKIIQIYTDGACSGNPGPGAYGVIMKFNGREKIITEGFRKTTNNRMELLAVIIGLEAIIKPNQSVTVFADSKYVIDAIEKKWVFGWVKKSFAGKKNKDLWLRLLPLLKNHTVKFVWVKGHNGHPENERCDELAVVASKQKDLPADWVFEQEQQNQTLL